MTGTTCVSCGTPLVGRYCHACGELDARERPVALGAFTAESLQNVTDLDGRTLRTLGLLFRRPGVLSREYLAGRRRPYLHPLQLFLLANLVFFLTLPFTGTNGLSSPLRSQLYDQVYSELARDAVRARNLAADSTDFRSFEVRFDQAAEVQARTLVIILVPMFAVVLFLTRAWRREPALHHLVFSLHYMAVVMIGLVGLGLAIRIVRRIPAIAPALLGSEWPLGSVLLLAFAGYLYAGLRHSYDDAPVPAAVRGLVLAASTVLLIMLYRFILFFTVLYTV